MQYNEGMLSGWRDFLPGCPGFVERMTIRGVRGSGPLLNLAVGTAHLLQYIYEQDSYSYAVAAVCGQTDHGGRESGDRWRSDERDGGAASGLEEASLYRGWEAAGL